MNGKCMVKSSDIVNGGQVTIDKTDCTATDADQNKHQLARCEWSVSEDGQLQIDLTQCSG